MRSKSWDEFATPDSPHMDFVITVCDQAAGEVCPIWPGKPITTHWGFEDPAAFEGSDEDKRKVFSKVYRQIKNRVSQFVKAVGQADAIITSGGVSAGGRRRRLHA